MQGGLRNEYRILVGKHEDYLVNLDVDRIILKSILTLARQAAKILSAIIRL